MVHILWVLTNVSCCVTSIMVSYRIVSLAWKSPLCHLFTPSSPTPKPWQLLITLLSLCLPQGVLSLETYNMQPFQTGFLATHLKFPPCLFVSCFIFITEQYSFAWMHHSLLIYLLKGILMASNSWHTQKIEIFIFKMVRFHLWILLHLEHRQMLPMTWGPNGLDSIALPSRPGFLSCLCPFPPNVQPLQPSSCSSTCLAGSRLSTFLLTFPSVQKALTPSCCTV